MGLGYTKKLNKRDFRSLVRIFSNLDFFPPGEDPPDQGKIPKNRVFLRFWGLGARLGRSSGPRNLLLAS